MNVNKFLRSAAVVAGLSGTVAAGGYIFSQALGETIKRTNDAHQEQVGAQPNLLTQWMNSTFGEASAEPVAVVPAVSHEPQPDAIAKLINNLDM